MDVEALVEGILAGDRRAVARAISAVEDDAPALPELSAGIYAKTGSASTIGLRGAPCSATGCGCRTTPSTPACSSARWRLADTWAGWPWLPPRPCGSWTRPDTT